VSGAESLTPTADPSRPTQSRLWAIAFVVVLAVAAALLTLWITRSGVGLSRDARSYLQLTKSITTSGVPVRFFSASNPNNVETHFPPGYPLVLSRIGTTLGTPATISARYLNAVLIVASTLLAAAIAAYATRTPSRGVLAAILFGASVGTCHTHLSVSSEPLFQVLMLAALRAGTIHLRRGGWVWLLIGASCAGLGVVVRYAGAAAVLAGFFAILLAPRPTIRWRRKIGEATAFALVASVPMACWVGWYSRRTGSFLAARTPIAAGSFDWERLRDAAAAMGEWITYGVRSDTAAFAIGMVAVIGLVAVAVLAWRAIRQDPDRAAGIAIPLAYLLIYPVFLLASVSYFDAATPFDRRILYPLHVAVIFLLATTLPARRWGVAVLGGLTLLQVISAAVWLSNAREVSLGYSSMEWQREPAIRFVRSLPRGATIVTDNTEVLELAAGRDSISLPRVDNLPDPGDRTAHRIAMAGLREKVPDGAYLVLINRNRGSRRYTPLLRLQKAFQLRLVQESPTGPIFIIDRPDLRPATQPTVTPATTRPDVP
jgi:4-amino-4-deoxy-L-arabinose transferase-like glycosyltransferase